jgi:hypothetical protein
MISLDEINAFLIENFGLKLVKADRKVRKSIATLTDAQVKMMNMANSRGVIITIDICTASGNVWITGDYAGTCVSQVVTQKCIDEFCGDVIAGIIGDIVHKEFGL